MEIQKYDLELQIPRGEATVVGALLFHDGDERRSPVPTEDLGLGR